MMISQDMVSPTPFLLPEDAAPKIRALYAYWQAIHPEPDRLPGRQHLDPLDIPELLANIWMADVQREPLRFRFRLVGTEIVKFTGRDSTGLWLDQVYVNYEETAAFDVHRQCALTGVAAYRRSGVISNPGRDFVEAERIYLPLAGNGSAVDILLAMTLYSGEPPSERARVPPPEVRAGSAKAPPANGSPATSAWD